MGHPTPSITELLVVARGVCEALGRLADRMPAGRMFLSGASLNLNARLGRAGARPRKSEAYKAIAETVDKTRSELGHCLCGDQLSAEYRKDAEECVASQIREVCDLLSSLGATARIARLSAEVAADEERAVVEIEVGATGARLLELAQELDGWTDGRAPIPALGPSEPLRSALKVCAIAFRRAALRSART